MIRAGDNMTTIGIICEFNPFHNGHSYFIQKIKEAYPDSTIICVMSGNYVERGEVSIIDKWQKTNIALENDIDLVVELPFVFASQSADLFCRGSVSILHALNVDRIIFGSESNNIGLLKSLAHVQLTDEYNQKVKKYMKNGDNYPTAMAKAFDDSTDISKLGPNDTLGIGYIRELEKLQSSIEVSTIQRTNNYHATDITGSFISATAARNLIKQKIDVSSYLPYDITKMALHFNDDYFSLLKYKIISETDLSKYQTVDEGIEHRLKKYILEANNFDELIQKVKTKRYTYHKLSRMFIHILTSFTKEEGRIYKEPTYIRILGFNHKGRQYLKKIKKNCPLPILTKYQAGYPMLEIESRTSLIYDQSLEYRQKTIQK